MKALIIIALLLHLALAQEESEQEEIVKEEPETKIDPKEAITFFILGDYGTVEPYESSHQVFAAID
jgi:hypothetical protein